MSQLFKRLVDAGQSAGEVIEVNRFIVTVNGLPGATVGCQVVTEQGGLGMVRSMRDELVTIDLLTAEHMAVGTAVVLHLPELVIHPSQALLGRIVDPLLKSLDGGAPILSRTAYPVFAPAPAFSEREMLNEQLETGVTLIDTLFPVVMGQRIAVMGDSKSGKTTFTAQTAVNQAKLGRVIVFVLIAKRKTEVEQLVEYLRRHDALKQTVLVVADSFDALPLAFIAPYSGCAVAEFFWQTGSDVVIIYDDLSSHAKIYREMALLGETAPGRESYPGDMFYRHSSLLERAGRRKDNKRTLTALPVMTTSNNDITTYLATSLISINDGQLIFDTEEMQRGSMPPINIGLSVSRVGGRAQEKLHKKVAQDIFRSMGDYRRASEFSHFGQELPAEYQSALHLGERVRGFFNQSPDEFFTLREQQVMLRTAFIATDGELDLAGIKLGVKKLAASSLEPEKIEIAAKQLSSKYGAVA